MSMGWIAKIETEGAKSLRDHILQLTYNRGMEKSICPTEAARAFRPERSGETKGDEAWRKYLRQVRVEAIGLARKGHIDILRKREAIDPAKPFKGVYRLRWKGEGENPTEEDEAPKGPAPERLFPKG